MSDTATQYPSAMQITDCRMKRRNKQILPNKRCQACSMFMLVCYVHPWSRGHPYSPGMDEGHQNASLLLFSPLARSLSLSLQGVSQGNMKEIYRCLRTAPSKCHVANSCWERTLKVTRIFDIYWQCWHRLYYATKQWAWPVVQHW